MTELSPGIDFRVFGSVSTQFGTDLLIPLEFMYSIPKLVVSVGPLQVFDLTSEIIG